MKPNPNLYSQRIISDFIQHRIAFFELIGHLNPEPRIITYFDAFSGFKDAALTRLITWHGLNSKNIILGPYFDLRNHPFPKSLESMTRNMDGRNFSEYISDTQDPDNHEPDGFIDFKIQEIKWFIKLWSLRNPYAPPYAPKRLSGGIKIVLNEDGLTVSLQVVSQGLWLTADYNPTRVVPLTTENLDVVIGHQVDLAGEFLK